MFGISADLWLYGICLAAGLLLSLPSSVGRSAHGGHMPKLHHAGHAPKLHHGAPSGHRVGHAQQHSAQAAHHGSSLPAYSFLNPIAFAAFLGGFGATGLIGNGLGLSRWLALPLALGVGLALSLLLFRLFVRLILASEGGDAPALLSAVGQLATVTVSIPADGIGTIAYVLAGRRETIAARTADQQQLPRSAEVVIVAFEHNVAVVVPYT